MEQNLFSMEGGFARFMNFLWGLIELSLLLFLGMLPVISTGAAFTAAYYSAAKSIRFHIGTPGREFIRSMRENFRQSLIMTVLFGAVMLVLLLDCSLFYDSQRKNALAYLYFFYGLILLTLVVAEYAAACLSRFRLKTGQLLRMAVLLPMKHLKTTVLLLILMACEAFALYLMPWGMLVFPGLGIYLSTFLLEPVLRRYTPKENGENKWYQS